MASYAVAKESNICPWGPYRQGGDGDHEPAPAVVGGRVVGCEPPDVRFEAARHLVGSLAELVIVHASM